MPEYLVGRDTDAAIAEFVLGWPRKPVGKDARGENGGGEVLSGPLWGDDYWKYLPLIGQVHLGHFADEFSTDINAAIHMLEQQFPFPKFYVALRTTDSGRWRCDIELNGGDGPVVYGNADTLPLAICRAALKAVGK